MPFSALEENLARADFRKKGEGKERKERKLRPFWAERREDLPRAGSTIFFTKQKTLPGGRFLLVIIWVIKYGQRAFQFLFLKHIHLFSASFTASMMHVLQ